MKRNKRMFAKMREAIKIVRTSGPAAAIAAIQRALRGISVPGAVTPISMPTPTPTSAPTPTSTPTWTAPQQRSGVLHDINPVPENRAPERSADPVPEAAPDLMAHLRKASPEQWTKVPDRQPVHDAAIDGAGKGKFLAGSHSNHAGTRAYKLYVPGGCREQALPLIVMLHGCQQNPDDFAAGTDMNRVAEESNCFVLYPAQLQAANMSHCWNWFKANDQQRDQGEPSIIADLTREICRTYSIDTRRIYVAGLSAGGAMAAIMGAAYPDLYAAVGIHSGLPVGAAHDLLSAFSAMKNGMAGTGPLAAQPNGSATRRQSIPVIVFHGDRDTTVHPRNGDQVLAQCTPDVIGEGAKEQAQCKTDVKVEQGSVPQGHAYTRTIRRDHNGKVIAEQWIVHGAGHAWSGGSHRGSFTDPKGPHATREMLRFFYMHTNFYTKA